MSTPAQDLIKAFDSLPAAARHEVAVEILRRSAAAEDTSETALHELADELFRGYDAEESANADASAG